MFAPWAHSIQTPVDNFRAKVVDPLILQAVRIFRFHKPIRTRTAIFIIEACEWYLPLKLDHFPSQFLEFFPDPRGCIGQK